MDFVVTVVMHIFKDSNIYIYSHSVIHKSVKHVRKLADARAE